MNKKDRAIGCLVGLAVGDALGTPVEFKDRDTFEPVVDFRKCITFNLNPGEWTDDTSMALALADSILETETINKEDLIKKFLSWFTDGKYSHNNSCFDIGNTTRRAIMNYYIKKLYLDCPDDIMQSGNGSIMRLAPVPIRWHNEYETALNMGWDQSITTHGSRIVKQSVNTLTKLLWNLINDVVDRSSLTHYRSMDRTQIKSSGYCVDTLDAALWAVGNTDNFNDAVLLAVNLGDDADTVGAVTGQIAGAMYGFSSIKKDWVERLAWNEKIIEFASKLYDAGSLNK